MRSFLLLLILGLAISFSSIAQTEALEKESLKKRFEAKEFSGTEYQQLANNWRDVINEYGGYPQLPYNLETKLMDFNSVFEYPNISKKVVFSRILEWTAINFGAISSVLHYQDFDAGKIIIKGYRNMPILDQYKNFWGQPKEKISTIKVQYTYVFTLLEHKLKIEMIDVTYVYNFGGYYNYLANIYIDPYKKTIGLSSLYPITNTNADNWRSRLSMLVETSKVTKKSFEAINDYILYFEDDYDF